MHRRDILIIAVLNFGQERVKRSITWSRPVSKMYEDIQSIFNNIILLIISMLYRKTFVCMILRSNLILVSLEI